MEAMSPYSFEKNLKQLLHEQKNLLRNQKQSILKEEDWEKAVIYRDIEKKLNQAIALFEMQETHVFRNGL